MKHLLLATVILLTTTVRRAEAAATPTPLTPDCRYLFVVDTSLSMSRLQDQVTSALQRMITTGLDGQMSPGEVFTIWTFNESVHQRDYPLNSWRPELNQSMGDRVRQYMQSQRFRREPNMRALLNALNQARQICPRIAIFFISNGQEVLVGTPFDRNINISYGRRFAELRAARVPFLTTLVCQDGRFAAWAVAAANEPIAIPPGPDGNLIVGRPKQRAPMGPTPVMTTNRPATPAQISNGETKTAAPVTPAVTNQALPTPSNTRPGVITLPGPPPTPRKVVELTPKPRSPDAPRIVKPTDIAPTPRKPNPVFRKTNAPQTNTNPAHVAKASSRPRSAVTMTVKSAKRPPPQPVTANTTTPSPAFQETNTVATPPSKTSPAPVAIAKPEPEVVIQVVTQIVMVPLPSLSPEKPTPTPPAAPPVETPKPEPKPASTMVTNSSTVAAVAKNPETNAPAPTAASPSTNAAATIPPVAEATGVAALFGSNAQNMTAWLFLAGGVLALLITIACFRRLMTRSGETSMISQSMERRDNG